MDTTTSRLFYSKNKDIIFISLVIAISFIMIYRLCYKQNFDVKSILIKYSSEEIDHFINFAFQDGRLMKWADDILISIDQNGIKSSNADSSIVRCINVLNTLMDEIQISIDGNKNSNFTIIYHNNLRGTRSGQTFRRKSLFIAPYPTIIGGYIDILIGDRKNDEINATINHEFSHLLGFNHNLDLYHKSGLKYKSWFNGPSRTYVDSLNDFAMDLNNYTDLDKAAIRIMYDADVAIDPGLTKEKFYRKIEEARRNMEK